jgi:MFS family permease
MMIACALVGIQQLGGLSLAVHDDGEIPSNGAVPSSTETRIAYVVTLLFGIMVCSRMVDYMGRKPCMLASLAGMCLCNLAMASAAAGYALGSARDALDVAIISFAFFYGLGMAAIPMLIAAELFPQHARGTAISLTLTLYWSYVFVETFAYELALDAFGASAIHVFFAVVCVVGAIYVKYAVLETANRALEDTVALVIPQNDVRVGAVFPSKPSRRKEAKRVVIL